MRKVREILRLTYDAGLPSREVARRVGVGSTGVRVMLQRFRASTLTWPLAEGLTDTALEFELYGIAATRGGQRDRPEPDWSAVNRELKRKHVTLQVLWDEYIEDHQGGYVRFTRLLDELALARGDGRIASRLKSLASVELLILDDWGLQPLDAQVRHDLLEILEDRYGRKSTIVTSQLPTASWHHAIGDATYADAILDRLLHNAHRVELEGDSLRRAKTSISD